MDFSDEQDTILSNVDHVLGTFVSVTKRINDSYADLRGESLQKGVAPDVVKAIDNEHATMIRKAAEACFDGLNKAVTDELDRVKSLPQAPKAFVNEAALSKSVHPVDREWGAFNNAPARRADSDVLIDRAMSRDEHESLAAQRELYKRSTGQG